MLSPHLLLHEHSSHQLHHLPPQINLKVKIKINMNKSKFINGNHIGYLSIQFIFLYNLLENHGSKIKHHCNFVVPACSMQVYSNQNRQENETS